MEITHQRVTIRPLITIRFELWKDLKSQRDLKGHFREEKGRGGVQPEFQMKTLAPHLSHNLSVEEGAKDESVHSSNLQSESSFRAGGWYLPLLGAG